MIWVRHLHPWGAPSAGGGVRHLHHPVRHLHPLVRHLHPVRHLRVVRHLHRVRHLHQSREHAWLALLQG